MTGRARDLVAALTERKDEAGALYEGALRVLADRENPARIRLTACGLRLLDEFQDAPKGEKLGNRVRRLKARWGVAGRSCGEHHAAQGSDGLPGVLGSQARESSVDDAVRLS
jgi:hypothetical protein